MIFAVMSATKVVVREREAWIFKASLTTTYCITWAEMYPGFQIWGSSGPLLGKNWAPYLQSSERPTNL